jgi:hypothetical protein
MKKKYRLLLIIPLMIGLFSAWIIYDFFREWKCCDYTSKYNKGIGIIQKIEFYRMIKGKLPDSLDDIGEDPQADGPIYYSKIDSVNYEIWFGTTLGESCVYRSETKKWTPY